MPRLKGYNLEELIVSVSKNSWLLKIIIWIFYVYGFFLPTCMSVHSMCLITEETRRGLLIPWKWGFRRLWAAAWVLGIKLKSFGRTASAPDGWSISEAPRLPFETALNHAIAVSSSRFCWFPTGTLFVSKYNVLKIRFPSALNCWS